MTDETTLPPPPRPADELLSTLAREVPLRLASVPAAERPGFVESDLASVGLALSRILERGLAEGPVFCEWGSGLGGVCAVAASLGYEAHGIEIEPGLVKASRELLDDLGLDVTIAEGSFLRADDAALVGCEQTRDVTGEDAYLELGLTPADCNVIFAFPWPGEELGFDRIFARHAAKGALFVTYHDQDRVLVQRLGDDPEELESLGWLGTP